MKNIVDTITEIVIEYYANYPELMRDDIAHTQEVVCYTHLIAVGEGYEQRELTLLECAAWLHDIGCPRSKEIYGNSLPVNQQNIGREVAKELLCRVEGLTESEKSWIVDVVGTHHQFPYAKSLSFEPLFEADLIVNMLSGYYSIDKAQNFYEKVVTTQSGRKYFKMLVK